MVVPVFVAGHYTRAVGSSVTGMLWAAMGVAGGAGALLAGRLRTMGRERHVMGAGMAITALAAWPVAAQFGVEGLAVGLMLAGLMAGPDRCGASNPAPATNRSSPTWPRHVDFDEPQRRGVSSWISAGGGGRYVVRLSNICGGGLGLHHRRCRDGRYPQRCCDSRLRVVANGFW